MRLMVSLLILYIIIIHYRNLFRKISRLNLSALTKFPVIVEIAAPLSSMWPKLAAVLILCADVKYRKYRLTEKHINTQTRKHTNIHGEVQLVSA